MAWSQVSPRYSSKAAALTRRKTRLCYLIPHFAKFKPIFFLLPFFKIIRHLLGIKFRVGDRQQYCVLRQLSHGYSVKFLFWKYTRPRYFRRDWWPGLRADKRAARPGSMTGPDQTGTDRHGQPVGWIRTVSCSVLRESSRWPVDMALCSPVKNVHPPCSAFRVLQEFSAVFSCEWDSYYESKKANIS